MDRPVELHRGAPRTLMRLNVVTIVLNGMPWIRHHLEVFTKLTIPWTWSLVHGIADPVRDTSWCHRLEEVEDDGTLPYVIGLAKERPGQVILTSQNRWPGKTAQINAGLQAFAEPGILLQVDADELWTTEQLEILVRLFEAFPVFDHALFASRLFLGPRRVTTHPGVYGNRWAYEWKRAWRWRPGQAFITHEPPQLAGETNAMPHAITAAARLVFDHASYATEAQVAFKEKYYGYAGAVRAWRKLQGAHGPQDLSQWLPWVKESVISYELPQ